jgi:predicted RNase H-like HicB family nuclease
MRSGIIAVVKADPNSSRNTRSQDLQLSIETEREVDGRWIAEIPEVPGALAYGRSEKEAISKATAIALRALADDVEKSQEQPPNSISFKLRAIA